MKIKLTNKSLSGFTLIEMIGVLAVIAILAALLIPKVFQAITEAKINTVPVGCATIKTAVIDHYAKYGGLANLKGGAMATVPAVGAPSANYDELVLLAEGFIDKPFAPRVGTSADIEIGSVDPTKVGTGQAVTALEGVSYSLAGATTDNDVAGSHVVYAKILQVPAADAQAISARIDGIAGNMSSPEATPGDADLRGRVKYGTIAAGSTGTVYIYLTHR